MSQDHRHACLLPHRRIEDFPIGNLPLAEHQQRRPEIRLTPIPTPGSSRRFAGCHPRLRIGAVDAGGTPIAWHGDRAGCSAVRSRRSRFLIRYPWDFSAPTNNVRFLLTRNRIEGEVHSAAVIEGVIHLGAGLPHPARGVHRGQRGHRRELQDRPELLYPRQHQHRRWLPHRPVGRNQELPHPEQTNVGHLSYVGDSVLGEKVNFGAGTIHLQPPPRRQNHRSLVDGELIDTGRRKFGAIVGDGVHTGIHTSIYPGRKLWPGHHHPPRRNRPTRHR
jgi:UDP-N-acetylglucosamine diphosphorylase / glucose-1-phosphate thymidylyltransferase / UDP-N-acetylgalactosamine diphosphorylase / glucosamine-1-phosphate N-acetyltransferase / galactosamine-1-phosphate N-acetyltransferase